jgi:predicted  nucleic acid-binding Zn-ribbon protein
MTAFEQLLVVQEHDTAIDRLRHRRETLPELTALAALENEIAALDRSIADASGRRDEAARLQSRLEDEMASVEAKLKALETKMYSGEVSVVRELTAMQADGEALRRRIGSLEDEVLAAMDVREPLEQEVVGLDTERTRLDTEAGGLRATIAEAQVAIDGEIAAEAEKRASAAEGLAEDLLALYHRLRAKHGGVGAAPLVNGRQCGGCHLTLSATEIDRFKRLPPEELAACEHCGRVLVR